jgi:hypothetical protein
MNQVGAKPRGATKVPSTAYVPILTSLRLCLETDPRLATGDLLWQTGGMAEERRALPNAADLGSGKWPGGGGGTTTFGLRGEVIL